MKSINSRISIREATQADNEGLLQLSSFSPMKGHFSIRVDRKPDFFGLLAKRGRSLVFIAERDTKIIAALAISERDVFIHASPVKAWYFADFKVCPDYQKSNLSVKLVKTVLEYLGKTNASLLYSVSMLGNEAVNPFFSGRLSLPVGLNAGIFTALQIIPVPCSKPSKGLMLVEVDVTDELVHFFNVFSAKFEFGLVYTRNSFMGSRLVAAFSQNNLVASIALTDCEHLKQEVIMSVPFILKCLMSVDKLIPIIRLPRLNQQVKILYIQSFACIPDHQKALGDLVAYACNLAYRENYHSLCVGLHENNPYKKVFQQFPHFSVKSAMHIASLTHDESSLNKVLKGIPAMDYSVV